MKRGIIPCRGWAPARRPCGTRPPAQRCWYDKLIYSARYLMARASARLITFRPRTPHAQQLLGDGSVWGQRRVTSPDRPHQGLPDQGKVRGQNTGLSALSWRQPSLRPRRVVGSCKAPMVRQAHHVLDLSIRRGRDQGGVTKAQEKAITGAVKSNYVPLAQVFRTTDHWQVVDTPI